MIIKVEINEKNYVCLYPVGYGNIIYRFASSNNGYTLIITGGIGQMTYTKPAEIAGNNTFTGINTFTKSITTTDKNGFIIAPGASANNHRASIWIDSATLADEGKNIDLEICRGGVIATEEWTTTQLQGLFTYANNTLTINI